MKKLLLGTAAVAGVAAVASVATVALAGPTTHVITACEGSNGSIRIVGHASACHHNETALTWNVTGPAGPAGSRGPRGPAGPTGSQGPKGDTGAAGAIGSQGPKGDTGAAGAIGSQGPKGDTGAAGQQGPAGTGGDPTADAFVNHFGTGTNTGTAADGETCTLGQILLSASPSVTVGGVPANGQILSISQKSALFALLGTTYGGNGTSTFALPDLRGLAPDNMTYSICDVGIFPARR